MQTSRSTNPSSSAIICVPVCEKDLDAMGRACVRAAEWAEMIELRLDCLDPDSRDIAALVQDISCPVILTFRPSEEGGHRHLSRDKRLSFWKSAPRSENVWWDVEGDLLEDLPPDFAAIIASHHDFSGVPTDLQEIYEQLACSRAAVIKIAVQAHDIVDCIPVFELLERARSEGRELIAIAMGNAGLATRILGPSRGSFLTYGAIDNDSATAPGQVNAHKLRSLYHIDKVDRETMICGLIGLPVMHSLSPRIHNAGFMSEGINGVYLPLEVRDVHTFCKRMVQPRTREIDWNLRGLSVTAPHKQAVMEHLDWIDSTAKEIGAVNTVVIEGERLLGYNTDAAGLIAPLLTRFGSLKDRKVAVIGAGGAARAAIWALTKQQASVTLFARNPTKAQPLAQSFDIRCEQLSSAAFAGYDLVINATPLGSGEHIDQSPATPEQLNGAGCIYDLIYNPPDTKLLREAREAGCDTLGGLEMLVAQAKIQFELWTGKKLSNQNLWL